jgi:hypothetical protein
MNNELKITAEAIPTRVALIIHHVEIPFQIKKDKYE